MTLAEVPAADYAVVGGSATLRCRFPEDVALPGVEVLARDLEFETPFGQTAPFKLIRLAPEATADGVERRVLAVRIHGWRWGENWASSPGQRQVFWALQQAGVRRIIGNAGVGALNPLLDPGDLVLADDFLDFTRSRPSSLHPTWTHSVAMVEPFCPALRALMAEAARRDFRRVFTRGVIVTVEGPRLEGLAETQRLRSHGGDLVAHSPVPEVHFAREIGACYAAAYLVVNHAPGVASGFDRDLMLRTYAEGAVPVARLTLAALLQVGDAPCRCRSYRVPITLDWSEP